ncbi:MAG: hypothetical protein HY376_03925 [Candidatus Blackburnbacteria bacterium]|nr:hypothetical protein [Candidatus Blackburnbacteria bacterium]
MKEKNTKKLLLFLVSVAIWIGLSFIEMWQAENVDWQKLFVIATLASFVLALSANAE